MVNVTMPENIEVISEAASKGMRSASASFTYVPETTTGYISTGINGVADNHVWVRPSSNTLRIMGDIFASVDDETHILFAEADTTKPVEVLRIGTFTDRNGKTVSITSDDLDAYVSNFNSGASGQDVPLDVDHRRQEAGGWIKSLERQGDKLIAFPEWNNLGRQLVADKVYKYLSATIDIGKKIIRSVSLVNFPAVKGLAPLELSEGVHILSKDKPETEGKIQEVTMPDEKTITAEDREAIEAEVRAKIEADLSQRQAAEAELREQITAELTESLEAELQERFQRRQELAEFANEVCNGEFALSAKPDEVIEFLEGLDEKQRNQAKALLSAKVVDFSERGSSQDGNAGSKLIELSAEVMESINDGLSLAEIINVGALGGKVSDYDTSSLTPDQIGA